MQKEYMSSSIRIGDIEIVRLIVGPLQTNCYLLKNKNEAVIIDPGWNDKRILKEIMGSKLKFIIATHGHFDHIMGANMFKDACFLIHKKDARIMGRAPFLPGKFSLPKVSGFLKEKDVLNIGDKKIKIIHTPGHTKGSISIIGDGFIFTGDTLFYDSVGRTDLAESEKERIHTSILKIEKYAKENTIIFPGHGPYGYFKDIKLKNPFLN